jgi:menaquinone-dependent protoporphyrinogen oxidase
MTILVTYATTEGQTRKIARRAAAHLSSQGRSVELMSVTEATDLNLAGYDGAILLASVHAGHYQTPFVDFVTAQRDALARLPTAFLSVSLSAASHEPEDREGIAQVVRSFLSKTGWTPGTVEHVAGAFRFQQYDFLKSWAMRWIAAKRDPEADPSGDTEYTDWDALDRFLDGWVAGLTAPSASARSAG